MKKRSEAVAERKVEPPTASTMAAMDRAINESENSPGASYGRELMAENARTERLIPGAALARYADFQPGDQLTITIGQELYSPIKYQTFTIGPFAATVTVRPDETGADAAMRCYRVLLELNEAEFNIAWERHKARFSKMPKHKGN